MIFSFIVLYQFQVFAYQILEKELSLYPTVGEYFEYNLYELVYEDAYVLYQKEQYNYDQQYINKIVYENFQLRWIKNPDVENVQIMNQLQEIKLTNGNQYKSISSNHTHFAVLSLKNEVSIYKWKNQQFEQVGLSLNIDTSYICFTIHLSTNFKILLDCYQNNQLYLVDVNDSQLNIMNSSQSSLPIKAKLLSIVNDNNTYLVYAQYYQNYSILSLISTQYQNLTYWNNNFVDFDIPIKINPFIYVLTQQQILQFSITSDYNFQLQQNYTQDNMTNFMSINVYYNYQTYSQCDNILVQYPSKSGENFQVTSLYGCENQIMLQNIQNQYKFDESIQTILQNNQYKIFQQQQTIILYQQGISAVFKYNNKIEKNSLLCFNADNELFSFHLDIIAYKVQTPSLQINLTNLQIAGNNTLNFSLQCLNQELAQNQYILKINLQILPKNDTNIYLMFNQGFPLNQYIMKANISTNFFSYSGQLLNYQENIDTNYFNFFPTTYNKINISVMQNCNLFQQLSIIQNFKETQLFLIGYDNESLYIFNCSFYHQNHFNKYSTFNTIQINVNANSLQVAYSLYPEIIVIGLSYNQSIYLFQQQFDDNKTCSQLNYTFESEILDFLVTSNNIIILFINKEIQIMTLDFQNIFYLNQQQINNIFKNTTIEFNPIQIVVNTQLLSSFLYINNVQDVIIISIQQNSKPIPISLIQVNFTIKQINLVNQQLILSYICNNNQSICFQVWNIQNLPKYYYEKSLSEVNNNNIIIQSDNLFFYVTFDHYTVYIYNPSLPQHMSLYYKLELNSKIQSSLAIQNQNLFSFDQAIILQQNTFYYLVQIQSMNISFNQESLHNDTFSFTYPQGICYYTVTSELNQSALQQTPNQRIIYLSSFTNFQKNKNIVINLTLENQGNRSNHFSYPINLIIDRQYTLCTNLHNQFKIIDIFDIGKFFSQGCFITYFNAAYNKNINNMNVNNNCLITSINNQFFALQSSITFTIFNGSLAQISYNTLNFSQCLTQTSYNYSLYLICQNNNTSQYLINFTLNSLGHIVNQTTTQFPNIFQNIQKMRSTYNQIFILGNFINQSQFLYWFNQYNNSFIQITQEFSHQSDNLYYCQDFSASFLQKVQGYQQVNMIIIFQTIRHQLFYQIMEIEGENVRIQHLNYVIIHYCYFQYSCVQLDYFNYVLIIKIIYTNAIILVTDKDNFSYLIDVVIIPDNKYYSNQKATVIRTIPNYYNYKNTGNSIYFDGILIQQFKYLSIYIMGIYYLDIFQNGSINQPILMQGIFSTLSSSQIQYAMIVNNQYHGIALYTTGSKIFVNPFSTQNITCNLKKNSQQLNVTLNCSNTFNYGNYTVTFNLVKPDTKSRGWMYALLIIITLLLFYFFYKVKTKIRELKITNLEVEL